MAGKVITYTQKLLKCLLGCISCVALAACSSSPTPLNKSVQSTLTGGNSGNSGNSGKVTLSTDTSSADEDLEDIDSSSKNKKPKVPKVVLPTAGKPTGIKEDTVVVQQLNEFLGASTLKLSKSGSRMEAANLIVIMPPGKDAIVYNCKNGNCMRLTSKTRALMSGNAKAQTEGELKLKVLGTEKIAGLNCTHYKLRQAYIDKDTKEETGYLNSELWATKELNLAPAVLADAAQITLMPAKLGFPMKIVRRGDTTRLEKKQGATAKKAYREVISTSAYTREKVDTSQFAYLTGYKPVTEEMKLMMSDDDSDMSGLDDLDK